jgi:hypothetical protein
MSAEDNVDIDSTEEETKTAKVISPSVSAEDLKKKRAGRNFSFNISFKNYAFTLSERFNIPLNVTEVDKKRKREERFGKTAGKPTKPEKTALNAPPLSKVPTNCYAKT